VNMGLLHQMSSLGCAFADALAVNRTLLLPSHVCGYKHNRRMKNQSMCTAWQSLLDMALLGNIVRLQIGSSAPRDRSQAVNVYCSSEDVKARFPCDAGGTRSHNLIVRAIDDAQYWYTPCQLGSVDTMPMQSLLLSSLSRVGGGANSPAVLVEQPHHQSTRDPLVSRMETLSHLRLPPRGFTYTLLRSGLFFALSIKSAAATIRARMGRYVYVHVRRGDRIEHPGSAPGVEPRLRLNLTGPEGIAKALRLWYPAETTIYLAPSDDSPYRYAPLALHYPRLYFAENFTDELGELRHSTYQMFAVELLLSLGADGYVETFASQLALFRQSCFPALALEAGSIDRPEEVRNGNAIHVSGLDRASQSVEVNGVVFGRACYRNTPCEDAAHKMYLVGNATHPRPEACAQV